MYMVYERKSELTFVPIRDAPIVKFWRMMFKINICNLADTDVFADIYFLFCARGKKKSLLKKLNYFKII